MVGHRQRKRHELVAQRLSTLVFTLSPIYYAIRIFTCFAKINNIIYHKDVTAISPLEVKTILIYSQIVFLNVRHSNSKFNYTLQKRILNQLATDTSKRQICQHLYQETEYILEDYLYHLIILSSQPEMIAEYKSHQPRSIGIAKQDLNLANKFYGDLENKKCLFVGCGGLPMTIIQMVIQNPKLKVDLLDMSGEALFKALNVIQKLSLENNLTCLAPLKVEDFKEIAGYEVVWFAIMVGISKEDKIKLYTEIHKNLRPHQVIITRTVSEGSFSELLYSPFPVQELGDKYQFLDSTSEKNCIVDSIALKKI